MRYYKVIVHDLKGFKKHESDPHTWAECEDVYNEYVTYDDAATVSIVFIGKEDPTT